MPLPCAPRIRIAAFAPPSSPPHRSNPHPRHQRLQPSSRRRTPELHQQHNHCMHIRRRHHQQLQQHHLPQQQRVIEHPHQELVATFDCSLCHMSNTHPHQPLPMTSQPQRHHLSHAAAAGCARGKGCTAHAPEHYSKLPHITVNFHTLQ